MSFFIKLPLISILMAVAYSTIETDEQRVVNSIFGNYNKKLRPVTNAANVINVTLDPALFSIIHTDEASESITILLWFQMKWIDVFIQWNSSEFGGIQDLLIPVSDIWFPDILIYNTISIETPIPDEKNNAHINFDGSISLTFAQILTIHCIYHITMFPFDIQSCRVNTGSWVHTADQLDMFYATPTDMSAYNENPELDLISMTANKSTYLFGDAHWVQIDYDIVIQRKSNYYLLTFGLPCFMITTISIIGIFAPFNDAGDREEKVTMGLTTLLTMTVILSLIADKMPKSSEGQPLLGTYILLQIGIAAVTSLTAVIIMYQSRKWSLGEPVPAWILTVTQLHQEKLSSHPSKAQTVANCSKNISKVDGSRNYVLVNTNRVQTTILKEIQSTFHQILGYFHEKRGKKELRNDWQRVCCRLDLILMFVFLLINLIVTIVLLIIGYSNDKII